MAFGPRIFRQKKEGLQQRLCGGAGLGCDGVTGQHAGNFVDTLLGVQFYDRRKCFIITHRFADLPVMRALGGHLGAVGDDQNLGFVCDFGQALSNSGRRGAPHTAVNFIENHRQTFGAACQTDL